MAEPQKGSALLLVCRNLPAGRGPDGIPRGSGQRGFDLLVLRGWGSHDANENDRGCGRLKICRWPSIAVSCARLFGGQQMRLLGLGGGGGSAAFHVLDHFARLKARRTDSDLFRLTVNQRPDILQVRVEAPFGLVIGVRDVVAGHRLLAAYFTNFCHL